jgi:hypothetical protein
VAAKRRAFMAVRAAISDGIEAPVFSVADMMALADEWRATVFHLLYDPVWSRISVFNPRRWYCPMHLVSSLRSPAFGFSELQVGFIVTPPAEGDEIRAALGDHWNLGMLKTLMVREPSEVEAIGGLACVGAAL